MKIAMIHLNLTSEAGDPRMFFSLIQAFRRAGHAVAAYTAEFDPQFFPSLHEGLAVRVVSPPRPFDSVRGASGIIGKIRERFQRDRLMEEAAQRIGAALDPDFDLVVAQNDASYRLGVSYKRANPRARFVWIMNNPPFYHTAKTNPLLDLVSRIGAFLAKRKIGRFVRGMNLIVVHDNERKRLAEAFPVPSVNLRIPVDFESFAAEAKRIPSGKRGVRLLGVGSLSPARKFDDIIRAAARLAKQGYDARVTLVARDFWKDAACREELVRLTEETGMKDRVQFLFEGASETELRAILRASDVYVFPNTFAIWSMSSFEAMAAGLPLVVSDATSVAEVLTDGENALFSKSGDPESIAEKVRMFIDSPDLYHAVAVAGQRYVREHLNWDAYAQEFLLRTYENTKQYEHTK